MPDLDPKPEATTQTERSARRAALGIREDASTESTVTFFNSPEAAVAMRRQIDRLGEQAPADDDEPPDEAAR